MVKFMDCLQKRIVVGFSILGFLVGCTIRPDAINIDGQDVEAVFLHTADIHSRLIPYELDVGATDISLGLIQANAPFGGMARLSALTRQLRRDHERFAYVDTGDIFQGAPIFNVFGGEPEFKALTNIGVDVMAIGNHEFDNGATHLVEKALVFANFPMLAANYIFEDPDILGGAATGVIAQPYQILNLKGLRVGVIGMGSIGSMRSIFEGGNSLGLRPLRTVDILQSYIDFLRPQVDLVVMVGHLGYHDDLEFIPRTEGLDIVFDGHLHIALNPPNIVQDCDIDKLRRETDRYRCDTPEKLRQAQLACETKEECDALPLPQEIADCKAACEKEAQDNCSQQTANFRYAERIAELEADIATLQARGCHPRDIPLVHSGAFLKYAGMMKAMVRQCYRLEQTEVCIEHDEAGNCLKKVPRRCVGRNGGRDDWEVIGYDYKLIPIDKNLPEDPKMLQLLEPYLFELNRQELLTQIIGFTPNRLRRFSAGSGDSQLGNLVANAMQLRNQVWADFSVTNSLGIRSDLVIGPVDQEQMTNVFPFENSVTVMYLSGYEVQELMDFVTQRSTHRGCQSQAQVAGLTATINCGGCSGDGDNKCARQPYNGEACAQRITIGGGGKACSADKDCPTGEICTGQSHPQETGKTRCWLPISCTRSYRLATNDYIAAGGSGFQVLGRNTTQVNLEISLRQAAMDSMLTMPSCAEKVPRRIVKDSVTGQEKTVREFVTTDQEEDQLKELEEEANSGNVAAANSAYEALRAALLKRQDAATDPKEKAGLTNYLACIDDCLTTTSSSCRGLSKGQIEMCSDYKAENVERCKAIARVRAAMRCITLPCIDSQEDGRLQRIFKDSSGSPDPFEPWPE